MLQAPTRTPGVVSVRRTVEVSKPVLWYLEPPAAVLTAWVLWKPGQPGEAPGGLEGWGE